MIDRNNVRSEYLSNILYVILRIKYRKRRIEKLITMNYSSEKKMEMMQLLDAIIQLFSISSYLVALNSCIQEVVILKHPMDYLWVVT